MPHKLLRTIRIKMSVELAIAACRLGIKTWLGKRLLRLSGRIGPKLPPVPRSYLTNDTVSEWIWEDPEGFVRDTTDRSSR